MTAIPRFRVPSAHRSALLSLLRMEEQSVRAMVDILNDPALPLVRQLVDQRLEQAVEELNAYMTGSLVEAVLSIKLTCVTYGWGLDEAAAGLADSDQLGLEPEEKTVFASRLLELLTARAVSPMSKAVEVIRGYERILQAARILTDVRPIFPEDADGQFVPLANVVVHTLRLDVVEDGNVVSVFVALDTDDLRMLEEAIHRALDKQESLAALLVRTGVVLHEAKDF